MPDTITKGVKSGKLVMAEIRLTKKSRVGPLTYPALKSNAPGISGRRAIRNAMTQSSN